MTNKRLCALALLSMILLAVTGCFFEHPLAGPDRNIDTWLLGVWEYKNDKGETYRAGIVPVDADHYTIWVRHTGKTHADTKNYRFLAWISRVDRSYFICAQCQEGPADAPPGQFIFLNYIVTGPLTVVLRQLQFDASPDATSFQLRAAVRAKLEKRDLYTNEGITVKRIGDIYRNPGGGNVLDQPLLPMQAQPPLGQGSVDPLARPTATPRSASPAPGVPTF